MRAGLTIFAIWAAGLGAAAQFGKMSVLFPWLQAEYADASPVAIGLIVSVVGLVGLIFGTTAGLIVARAGLRRVLVLALIAGAGMSAVQALGLPYPLMIASRMVEGVSHLAIVVIGPSLMAGLASDRMRGAVMTLWSSFFGLSYTLLALFAPWDAGVLYLGHAVWMLAMAGVLWALLPADRPVTVVAKGGIVARHLAIYASPRQSAPALGFFCYTFLYVAILTLLPPAMPESARALAAVGMPLISIVLSLTLGVWLLGRIGAVRLVQGGYWLAMPAFVLLALGWGDGMVMLVAGLWISSALGLVQGASFAAIPALNQSAEDRAGAAGAIAQLGNVGTTTGTPVLAAVLAGVGPWGLLAVALVACGLGIGLHALQEARRQAAST